MAVIRVGAATETEVNERKLRVEDAINAARAAVEEGVIAGGGSVLVQISKELESFAEGFEGEAKVGVLAVARALTRPAYWIAENAGLDGAVVVSRVAEMSNGEGFNANTLEYGNLIDNGIVDPVKVTHSAVVNCSQVVSALGAGRERRVRDSLDALPHVQDGRGRRCRTRFWPKYARSLTLKLQVRSRKRTSLATSSLR